MLLAEAGGRQASSRYREAKARVNYEVTESFQRDTLKPFRISSGSSGALMKCWEIVFYDGWLLWSFEV